LGGYNKAIKNGVLMVTVAKATQALPNSVMYLGASLETNTGTIYRSNKECAFASIGSGLTDAEHADLNTRVQAFLTALG
jgi:hypothetical protein